jgi:hypothetical protein
MTEIGRNDPCPCGSGKKYKRCCGSAEKRSDMRHKVGDIVEFRSWESMEKEFGTLNGNINTMPYEFCGEMEQHLKGRNRRATIDFDGGDFYLVVLDGETEIWKSTQWPFKITDSMLTSGQEGKNMIAPADKPEDGKEIKTLSANGIMRVLWMLVKEQGGKMNFPLSAIEGISRQAMLTIRYDKKSESFDIIAEEAPLVKTFNRKIII